MGKNRKCASEANNGKPGQTMVTINKYIVSFMISTKDM